MKEVKLIMSRGAKRNKENFTNIWFFAKWMGYVYTIHYYIGNLTLDNGEKFLGSMLTLERHRLSKIYIGLY